MKFDFPFERNPTPSTPKQFSSFSICFWWKRNRF